MDLIELERENASFAYTLHQQAHFNPWNFDTFSDCLDGQYFAWQITNESECLGFYIGLQVLDEITLMDIVVSPQYRQQGIATKLMNHFLSQSQQRQGQKVWLEVRESNAPAIHLYQKHGFELIETRKNYYPCAEGKEHARIMCLSLSH